MPVQRSYQSGTPVELLQAQGETAQHGTAHISQEDAKVRDYVLSWRNKLRYERIEKVNVWNECWALYRGLEDFSNKEDWQSKIVLPKAWGTVKQAVSAIKQFLHANQKTSWRAEPENPDDQVWQLRAEKMTNLSKVFLDKAQFLQEFATGLETGFIMGLGVWKFGWNIAPRMQMTVQTSQVPNPTQVSGYGQPSQNAPQSLTNAQQGPSQGGQVPTQENPQAGPPSGAGQAQLPEQMLPSRGWPSPIGQPRMALASQQQQLYPNQLGGEALLPPGSLNMPGGQQAMPIPQKQVIRQEVQEGKLSVNAVDPYFFYWLPGSKLNAWTGTIEEMEVPKWQLLEMAEAGAFDPELIKQIGPKLVPEYQRQTYLRFGELPRGPSGPTTDTGIVTLTEFYGPLVLDGKVVEKQAHIIIANDTWVLLNSKNDKWFNTPPYCAFSPLQLPFRTEGVGLVEMVRYIDRALNQIVNLGVDTLMFRLMPLFEFTPDFYENPEDLKNGITPGKILKRNTLASANDSGIKPVEFNDVSPGAAQISGILDRAHQEGGLVSELQQSLPRWSGAQTATETEAIQNNQQSFFGSLASDIEKFALAPMIKMSIDLIMQFIDTSNDVRVAAILGIDQQILAGMSHAELYEMIAGDYDIKVTGLTEQLDKAQTLQNLVQLMNIIGQNPESWLPYINQDALLQRILESFRPTIQDIEKIIADPQTVAANKAAAQQQSQLAELTKMIPQLSQQAHQTKQDQIEQESKSAEVQQKSQQDAHVTMAKVADQAIAFHQAKTAENKPTGGK